MVLLPEGKIINNPDSVKLIKVLPTTVNDKTFFVVAIKLDDDSELMVDRCATRLEAEDLANRCCRLLNGEAIDDSEIPSFVGSQDEDSSDWEDSEEEAEDLEESDGAQVAEEESSSWDLSSSEEHSAGEDDPSATKSTNEEESSSWDLSSSEEHSAGEAQKQSAAEEDSSSWDLSSSDEMSVETSQSANVSKPELKTPEESKVKSVQPKVKPKIQEPYREEVDVSSDISVRAEPVSREPAVESLPRVTAFIEDDSDEWIQDNGLDDWYD